MSILTELKKLTKKKNATVVSQALPDSLDGSGSGGGGANVLTLYLGEEESRTWAYKDPERTEKYATYEEALNAVKSVDVIKAIDITDETSNGAIYTGTKTQWSLDSVETYVKIQLDMLAVAYLYYKGGK